MRNHWLIPDAPFECYQDYLRVLGGSAVPLARRRSSEQVVEEIQLSGLRGRGGAGFPTGTKWRTIQKHSCRKRFVVCNAAEGEPGTFKDRYVIRKNPYAILEGMLIASHAVGSTSLFIAIKASFKREIARLLEAIGEIRAAGLLDEHSIELVEGPEEYLFGEEKALLEVIEGGSPLPRESHYPPYEKGLFSTPTEPNPALVNNAQTFGLVPGIILSGAASFRALGTHDTPGTLIFTVIGDVKRPGVYESEAGITLRELFCEVAGGPREGRTLKAAVPGVSAGIIPASRFDTPAEFASLQLIGSGLGSAGFIVLDDLASGPRVTQALARFLYVESCNQCIACKHGLRVSSHALDEIFDPDQASPDDIDRAFYGARSAPQGNRCYLPVQGSILIPSLLEHFREEFELQIEGKAPSRPVLVPKILDYDETAHTFILDERQTRKTPLWTYEEEMVVAASPAPAPEETTMKASAPAATPRDASRGPVGVRLAPDVFERILARADTRNLPLDALVNEALREWLERQGG